MKKGIRLEAVSICKNTQTIAIDEMTLQKVRGCNRNEDCVYFNDTEYIVYSVNDDDKSWTRDAFVRDMLLFTQKIKKEKDKLIITQRIKKEDAAKIFEFISSEHDRKFAESTKPASHYAHDDAELIAINVLRDKPRCNYYEFRKSAFYFAIANSISKKALTEAILNYA